jgi:glutathione peroxidase
LKKSVYNIRLKDINGQDIELKNYKGKKLNIVNVASLYGYNPQYAQLQNLYRHYKDKEISIG